MLDPQTGREKSRKHEKPDNAGSRKPVSSPPNVENEFMSANPQGCEWPTPVDREPSIAAQAEAAYLSDTFRGGGHNT
jgi:hypothetical protein